MSKEKQIQEYQNKQLIDELSKMPPMVIATAYLHAINYTLYGEDVTEKWVTAIQKASALEKAYQEGYHDALQRREESLEKEPCEKNCNTCGQKCAIKYHGCSNWTPIVEEKSCSDCKFWCLNENDENRRCKYCYRQDEWQAESEG